MILRAVTLLLIAFFCLQIPLRAADTQKSLSPGKVQRIRQVLANHDMSLEEWQQRGFLLGEVTGAGKRVYVDDVVLIISRGRVYSMRDLVYPQFMPGSRAQTIGDLDYLEFRQGKVDLSSIEGFISSP